MFGKTILQIGWLLSGVLVWTGGVCLAQRNDLPLPIAQQRPSTSDLENQPNTYNYPQRHGGRVSFNATQAASNSQTQPSSPAGSGPVAMPVSGARPGQANGAPANPQNSGSQPLIGPPAPNPPTLEEMAPAPPKVIYENGLLSVESVNARLSDILVAIRAKAGIQFEGATAGTDRVAGKFGPASAGEVLTSLLEGSRFDYVIIGTPDNPSQVQKVMLSLHSGSSPVAGAANPGAKPVPQANSDEDDDSDDSAESQPAQVPQQGAQAQPGQPRSTSTPSTEQLVEELKRMQRNQQGRQQQNQQVPPNPQ